MYCRPKKRVHAQKCSAFIFTLRLRKKKSSFVTTHQSWSTFWLIVVFLMPTQYFKPTAALLTYKQLCGWSSGCHCSFRARTALFFLLKLSSAVSGASTVCFHWLSGAVGFDFRRFSPANKKAALKGTLRPEPLEETPGRHGQRHAHTGGWRLFSSLFIKFHPREVSSETPGSVRRCPGQ